MRPLKDQHLNKGNLWNGFDYDLQVYVRVGKILNCAHPDHMTKDGYPCCNARKFKTETLKQVRQDLGLPIA